jgi:hypothetical protein
MGMRWREMWKRLFMGLASTDGLQFGRQGQEIFVLSKASRPVLGLFRGLVSWSGMVEQYLYSPIRLLGIMLR